VSTIKLASYLPRTGPCVHLLTPEDALLAVAILVETHPELHTTGVLARTPSGVGTSSQSPAACQFCAQGMLSRLDHEQGTELKEKAMVLFSEAVGEDITDVNDTRPREELVSTLRAVAAGYRVENRRWLPPEPPGAPTAQSATKGDSK
jgi:hypothetical protein